MQYFLPVNYDHAQYSVSKIVYDLYGEFMSWQDHLVDELLAHEMYHKYALSMLKALPKPLKED